MLILGGTLEARKLADTLVQSFGDRLEVTTSLAGRTTDARRPLGEIRTGGFGGVEGLIDYLTGNGIDLMIDATHPFAAEISAHAAEAAKASSLAHIMLSRPTWDLPPDLIVHRVPDLATAAFVLTALEATRVLVTVGHRGLEQLDRFDGHLVIRQIDAHEAPLPLDDAIRLVDRPPYSLEGELALMEEHRIDALLTKESGGSSTAAKLEAARQRGIPVVMIERPPQAAAALVSSVDEAVEWVSGNLAD